MVTNKNNDREFLKRFTTVIGSLVAVTLILILASRGLRHAIPIEPSAATAKLTLERIAPVGAVYAGSTGAAAAAAAQAAAAAKASAAGAYDGTLDGKVIFDKLCTACHLTGVGMAPMLVQADWAGRITQGKETLYQHAIEGYNGPNGGMMPAKGGNPGLSEAQVHAAVDWMLDNLK